jgi:hypothetical protein
MFQSPVRGKLTSPGSEGGEGARITDTSVMGSGIVGQAGDWFVWALGPGALTPPWQGEDSTSVLRLQEPWRL